MNGAFFGNRAPERCDDYVTQPGVKGYAIPPPGKAEKRRRSGAERENARRFNPI